VRGQSLALKYCKNQKRTDYRLAVVVSKKVHKSAVTRNRIRRRVYEIIRKKTDLKDAYDMIISVYDEGVATCTNDKLESQVIALIAKAGIS
jgi:ribonuclease P protein component